MKFRKKISKKELIKTLQNNYEVVLERKNELYSKNIELQQDLKKQEKAFAELIKDYDKSGAENSTLKIKNKDLKKQVDELKKELKKIKDEFTEANKRIVDLGIQLDEVKNEKKILKGKYTKLKNKTDVKVEITAPSIEKGNKIVEEHFREQKTKGGTLTNGRF